MLQKRRVAFALQTICLFVLPTAFTIQSAANGQIVATSGPRYSNWSKPVSVGGVNTVLAEYPNGISRDGLSLYFQRTNLNTGEDLYVAHRPDLESNWGVPVKLPDTVNSNFNERAAFVSSDGHWLYFASDRPNGTGGADLYVSRRTNVHDDGDWQAPTNISAVNSPGFDSGPTLFEDEVSGTTQLYFNSAPDPGGLQARADIYVSTLGPKGFGPPAAVTELNSSVQEGRPYLRRDGCEIYFQSNRSGALAIWVSTRSSTAQLWSPPVIAISAADLGDTSVAAITTPVLSWDNRKLFVGVVRPGIDMGAIFVSSREKVNEPPVAVVKPQSATWNAREMELDGSDSSDPEGEPLAYSWKCTGKPAAMGRAETAKPWVQFSGGYGEYSFELTVTDPQGASAKAIATILYTGR